MRPLHWNPERKRMPVVLLGDEAETLWLDPMTTDPASLRQFFGPLPWEGWTYHRVNKLPNDGKDNPALIKPA
jgi:putative SOS response-associated peptidase YedK